MPSLLISETKNPGIGLNPKDVPVTGFWQSVFLADQIYRDIKKEKDSLSFCFKPDKAVQIKPSGHFANHVILKVHYAF